MPWPFCLFSRDQHANHSVYVDPLTPHFYIVKLEFTGVFIYFLFFALNTDHGYSLELPHSSTHDLCFEQKYEKRHIFLLKIIVFRAVKNPVYCTGVLT